MEQNFQTSFIPKKPIIEERTVIKQPVSFLLIISVIILFITLILTGGLYVYKGGIMKAIDEKKISLKKDESRFEPEKIKELKVLDMRLRASSEILSHHISITPIFKVLQDMTMKTVRYNSFDYVLGVGLNGNVTIKLKGQAVGYSAIALQADIFTQNKNLIDPVFSNLLLTDKGDVTFDLSFSVAGSFLDYKQTLATGDTL